MYSLLAVPPWGCVLGFHEKGVCGLRASLSRSYGGSSISKGFGDMSILLGGEVEERKMWIGTDGSSKQCWVIPIYWRDIEYRVEGGQDD